MYLKHEKQAKYSINSTLNTTKKVLAMEIII